MARKTKPDIPVMTKRQLRDWMIDSCLSGPGGQARFCKLTGCPTSNLTSWLDIENKTPLPWWLPFVLAEFLRKVGNQALRKRRSLK